MKDSISIKDVEKRYRLKEHADLEVLDNVSLEIKKGEFIGIVGPNGCGKTTLLKMVMGVESPESGAISVFGKNPEEARLGYVPQHTAGSLYPWFTASQNIAFVGPSMDASSMQKSLDKLQEFGIKQYANSFPYQLSGGIKQLVAIARAIMFNPDAFLLDEPFNALDYQNRSLVEHALFRLRESNATAIIVSHDIESTVLLCDKIIVLSEKPSRIRAVLPISLPKKRDANTRFSPEFTSNVQALFRILEGDRHVAQNKLPPN